jgi:aminoglycoside phosphotransferase (APT) family kinase protein
VSVPPPARGVRREWGELPAKVLAEVESLLGARVVAATSQPSGFSPGIAARVITEDGRRAFVKAVGPEPNPDSPEFHRRELQMMESMPADAPVPRLLGGIDEGEGGWVALALEDLEARHPAEPWTEAELGRVFEGAAELVAALTPSPLETASVGEFLAAAINSWHHLRDELPEGLDEWSLRNLERLVELEARAGGLDGPTLLHLDIRADNLLLADDRVYFVDWPHARRGPPWLDAVCFAPSVSMQGGPPPAEVLERWPGAAHADPDDVTAAVASVAGFFVHRSLQPLPPGLPTLRPFQVAQRDVALRWLAERTGWS